jgi:hypothetical protein
MRWSTAFFAYLFACYGLGVATTLIAQGERQDSFVKVLLVLLIGAFVAFVARNNSCFQ